MSIRRFASFLLIGVFFASTLFLSWPTSQALFVSPDEHAAFVFADTFAHTGSLFIPESLNEELSGIIHPRSAIGYADGIVPASFIGFIVLLGMVGSVFGKTAMFLVTPIVAVLTLYFWRDSVRRLFHDNFLADAAAFLLMLHPAFWYYTGRVMMHNVAFLGLLVLGTWWCLALPLSTRASKRVRSSARMMDFSLAGMIFGLALVVRTVEIFWLIAALSGLAIVYRSVLGWRAIWSFVCGFGVALLLLAGLNVMVYGAPFVNGYTSHYPYATTVTTSVDTANTEAGRTNFLLPFGFHERNILDNVWNYGWKLYPWMSVLALIGGVLVLCEKDERQGLWRILTILTLGLAIWLGVVYGSWRIIDNPDPTIISLGNSHVRYWLPLFALGTLFGAKTLRYMYGDGSRLRMLQVGGVIALVALLSLRLVFFGHDGFVPSQAAVQTFAVKKTAILAITESESIVIVDRADKYLFPERRVVVPLRSDATYAALPSMLLLAPVYYFGITLPATDIEYLNEQKLPSLGLRIEHVKTLQEESLYRFVAVP